MNNLEKMFSLVLENWLSLKLISESETESQEVKFGASVAADVLSDILKESGFITDASDFFLERQQIRIESLM